MLLYIIYNYTRNHGLTTPIMHPLIQKGEPYVYAGHILKAHGPVRDPTSKWHMPTSLYAPARFPSYAEGPLYVLSQVSVYIHMLCVPATDDRGRPPFLIQHTYTYTTAPGRRPPLPNGRGQRRGAQHLFREGGRAAAPARGALPVRGCVYRCVIRYMYIFEVSRPSIHQSTDQPNDPLIHCCCNHSTHTTTIHNRTGELINRLFTTDSPSPFATATVHYVDLPFLYRNLKAEDATTSASAAADDEKSKGDDGDGGGKKGKGKTGGGGRGHKRCVAFIVLFICLYV